MRLERIWLLIITVVTAVSIYASAAENRERVTDLSRETRARAAVVYEARLESVRLSCEETNARRDRVVALLDELIERSEDPRARAGRARTLLFINTLVPRRHCVSYAQRIVR